MLVSQRLRAKMEARESTGQCSGAACKASRGNRSRRAGIARGYGSRAGGAGAKKSRLFGPGLRVAVEIVVAAGDTRRRVYAQPSKSLHRGRLTYKCMYASM